MIRIALALSLMAVFSAATASAATPHRTHAAHATAMHGRHASAGKPTDADHSADSLNAQSLSRVQSTAPSQ